MLRLDERLLRRCQAALSLRDFAGARTGPIATSTGTGASCLAVHVGLDEARTDVSARECALRAWCVPAPAVRGREQAQGTRQGRQSLVRRRARHSQG